MNAATTARHQPGDPMLIKFHDQKLEQEFLGAEFWAAADRMPGAAEFIATVQSALLYDERNREFHDAMRGVLAAGNLDAILDGETEDCPLMAATMKRLSSQGRIDPLNLEYFQAIPTAYTAGTRDQCKAFAGELGELYLRRWALAFAAEIVSKVNAGVDCEGLAKLISSKAAACRALSDRIAELITFPTPTPKRIAYATK